MVLPGSEEVQTRLLGQDCHLDGVLDALVLTGGLAGGRVSGDVSNREDSELYETSSLFSTLDFNDFLCTERTGEAYVYLSTIWMWCTSHVEAGLCRLTGDSVLSHDFWEFRMS